MIDQPILKSALQEGLCTVTFTKVNGDERVMTCTTKADLLPPVVEVVLAEGQEPKAKKTPNPDVMAVYDTLAEGWRSFRWDSVKSYTLEQ
jgi:hypothetical protein|tara:strand:+ start:270 stop:539 length:270 start_codon:yes stop_codon:yes gene_type:complete